MKGGDVVSVEIEGRALFFFIFPCKKNRYRLVSAVFLRFS